MPTPTPTQNPSPSGSEIIHFNNRLFIDLAISVINEIERIVGDEYLPVAVFAVIDEPYRYTIHLCRYCCAGIPHIVHAYDPWEAREYFFLVEDGIANVIEMPEKTAGGCSYIAEYVGTITLSKKQIEALARLKKLVEKLPNKERKRLYRIAKKLYEKTGEECEEY